MKLRLCVAVLFLAAVSAALASDKYKNAVKARIDKAMIVVLFADGTRTMVPLSTLSVQDREALVELSRTSPLPAGKSSVVVAPTDVVAKKKTVVKSTTEGPLETVQLCAPNVPRNQIGGTCMLYGRVHWLDIAGYYLNQEAIYKVPVGDPNQPWTNPGYLPGLDQIVNGFTPKPVVIDFPVRDDPFTWAREQLRKGRPLLAAFPREIWQALPPAFISHPWRGGPIGHQIVVNGFTWNSETKQGTFHIINSWSELPEFDLTTEAAGNGNLIFQSSMVPKGEPPPEVVKETVKSVTLLRAVGKTNLYEVETNTGKRRVAATSEDAARTMVENGK